MKRLSVVYVVVFKNELLLSGSSVKDLHSKLIKYYPISYDYLSKLLRDNDGKVDLNGFKIYRIRP